jgi:ABC-2 type transport system permease protein
MTFFRDTWLIFSRSMRLSLRNPIWVVLGLIQPILYLVLFGPLLKKVVASTPGLPPGNEWQIFVPGLLVLLGLFGAAFVGFGLIAEWRAGVIERQRVSPASRVALLAGRVLRDVVVLLVQAIILTLVAIAFGLRAPVGGVILAIVVVAGLGAAFASLSYGAALRLKSEDALAPLFNGLAIPLQLLSGILLPMSIAPLWLRDISNVNPLKHIVDGVRVFFTGDIASSAGVWGLVWTLGLVIAGLWFGTSTFRRESA